MQAGSVQVREAKCLKTSGKLHFTICCFLSDEHSLLVRTHVSNCFVGAKSVCACSWHFVAIFLTTPRIGEQVLFSDIDGEQGLTITVLRRGVAMPCRLAHSSKSSKPPHTSHNSVSLVMSACVHVPAVANVHTQAHTGTHRHTQAHIHTFRRKGRGWESSTSELLSPAYYPPAESWWHRDTKTLVCGTGDTHASFQAWEHRWSISSRHWSRK